MLQIDLIPHHHTLRLPLDVAVHVNGSCCVGSSCMRARMHMERDWVGLQGSIRVFFCQTCCTKNKVDLIPDQHVVNDFCLSRGGSLSELFTSKDLVDLNVSSFDCGLFCFFRICCFKEVDRKPPKCTFKCLFYYTLSMCICRLQIQYIF